MGTIVAVGSMLTPGAEAPAALVGMLRDEGERLEALLGLLRLLGGESGEPGDPEPVHLPDVVGPIVALHAQHPALRDVPVAVSDADVAPVRARRDGLARALLVLLSAAKRGGEARVAWHADGRTVALRVDGAAGEPHAAAAAAAAAAALLGEPVRATETGYEVALPALGGLG
ncbi:MAG: hypothetical protein JO180_12090 [Gemmatirosa sp.]|nr:hypothetical protein [Gemmatirosa sp.]